MPRQILDHGRVVSPDVRDGEGSSSGSRCETSIEVAKYDESVSDNVGSPTNPDLESLPSRIPGRVRRPLLGCSDYEH